MMKENDWMRFRTRTLAGIAFIMICGAQSSLFAAGSWTMGSSSSPGAYGNRFNAATAMSASEIWAVGSVLGYSGTNTLIARWDGSSWNGVSSPNPAAQKDGCNSTNVLTSVDGVTSNDVWAVGSFNPAIPQ
jgi:hypothetical protein